MRIYGGISALSDFRTQKLLKSIQKIAPHVTDVQAEYIHFVDVSRSLTDKENNVLEKLTSYGNSFLGDRIGDVLLVVPRPGTISPWSSKATDITHNSGLTVVTRIERGVAFYITDLNNISPAIEHLLHDRMSEVVLHEIEDAKILFETHEAKELAHIDISTDGKASLIRANKQLGLALADDEIDYLYNAYSDIKRDPTDVELMMFAQVNSEHCRHKIFNADWVIDGQKQPKSLFKMIKNTYEKNNEDILSAYHDNAAVLRGPTADRFFSNTESGAYSYRSEPIHSVIKVETHNHPTAISPIPGAATGIGGEIRDEAATGRGAKSKMGLSGYSVSNLSIPDSKRPWEKNYGKPSRIVSALDIMLEAPIGGAGFANEFGRPNVNGYFRTFEHVDANGAWGYHKPIMIAGGLGNIRDIHVDKNRLPVGSLIIHLGGPSMLIGLGGGAASSMHTGASDENLDFASVQRGNGEIERRAQEVIDHCWALGEENPIITIHDVGAGGLSNALPEIVHDSGRGARVELRDIPSAEPSLSPLEIWCNESQERYMLGIAPEDLASFKKICERERCPYAVVGTVTEAQKLVVHDSKFNNDPIDIDLSILFGKPPKMTRNVTSQPSQLQPLDTKDITLEDSIERVLTFPAVGSKKFLITIGDRTVGGLVTRDQMVGPWQVPVSDAAVTAVGFNSNNGEAMAMGERTPLAMINPAAAARMAIAEAITNIASADIEKINDIKLSANWMAAVGHEQEDGKLFDSVRAVGEEFCPALGMTIPVGKDSLSMKTSWHENNDDKSVTSPVSLIVTGFSPITNVTRTLTPELSTSGSTQLYLINLGSMQPKLGGSSLAQVYNQLGDETPDVDADVLKHFFSEITRLKKDNKVLAYHDRSDGGLLTTVLELAFASRCGLEIDITKLPGTTLERLFNEELGVVIQVNTDDAELIEASFGERAQYIGRPTEGQDIKILDKNTELYKNTRSQLESWWSDTSYLLQKLRDNPQSADEEHALIHDDTFSGLTSHTTFTMTQNTFKTRPNVAIFREEGVNGHIEMAAAFDRAGFTATDVHLNDIISGRYNLDDFVGLIGCGGFSYGDVLGAGEGWAKSILYKNELRTIFSKFFTRTDTFSLGVCNGCQMLAALKELIPGAELWPSFLKNTSEQFEARVVLTAIDESPSIFFKDMAGSHLPVPVAHGEGRAVFLNPKDLEAAKKNNLISARYVDSDGKATERYPLNPNGSIEGITALTSMDGRATIIMPHPERAFLSKQLSWHPSEWGEESPWMQMFNNARNWVENTKKS